jgi:DNA polymerase-3 subunit gamma/tau
LLDALLAGDARRMLEVADSMAMRSLSFDQALQELASLLTRLQVAQLAPAAIAEDWPERQRVLAFARHFDPEYIQLAYQIAVHGRKELSLAPDEQAGFVMTLLRVFTFRPMRVTDVAATAQHAAVEAPLVRQPVSQTPPVQTIRADLEPVATSSDPGIEAAAAPPVAVSETAPLGGAGQESADWHEILEALKLGGMARELAQHCQLRRLEQGRIVLCLAPSHRHLQMKPAQEKLQQVLSEYFGRSLQLAIEIEATVGDTPAATAQRRRQEQQDRAIASVEQDSFVREVIDVFDATLIESSIKPV